MARSIRENIIYSFAAFSIVSLILVGVVSLFFLGTIGQTTTTMSTNALTDQIQDNIQQTAIQNAQIINRKLSNAEAMVNAMAKECDSVLDSQSTYTSRRSFYDFYYEYNRGLGLFPVDTYLDPLYNVYLSWQYASYYFPGSNSSNYLTILANDPVLNDTVSRMAHMDYIFQEVHSISPDIRWLYIAFEGSDLFINYPGSVVGDTDLDRNTAPFSATQEDWYKEVRDGNGQIVFTAPYFDPIDGALLITIGKAFYDPSSPTTLLGCIFADITIESIKEKIIDITILESGYAALIQQSGLVVAHPDWTAINPNDDLPAIEQVEVNLNSESALTVQQIDLITSGATGVTQFTKNADKYYLAYTAVGKGDYICLIIVPENEAIASVAPLQQRIEGTTLTSLVQLLVITIGSFIISLTVGIWMSNRIISPISHLTNVASKMATDRVREDILGELDLQIDQELENQDDEVGDLTRAFKGMLSTIRKESKKDKDQLSDSFWDN
jgi:nitrogen fixation/metabolism regulation signal transduction histidine kinase